MAARCGGKAIYLALDISQMALSAVLCSVYSYGFEQAACGPPGAFLSTKGRCKVTKANTAL